MKQRKFCIVGLGLLGGSYARALTQAGFHVTGIDICSQAIEYAVQRGWIVDGTADAPARLLAQAQAIVLGLYPQMLVPWVREHQAYFQPGVMLTDVCGVKRKIANELQQVLRSDAEWIGCHPMAGREVSGIEHADPQIFQGANFLITPTARNTAQGIAFAHRLAEILGFGRITELSCERHDRMIGYVSQLTHVIAVALMNANDDPQLPQTTGDSFRDLTRIAKINEMLWSELFFANGDILCQEMDRFMAEMQRLREALQQQNAQTLQALMRTATQRRIAFDAVREAVTKERQS